MQLVIKSLNAGLTAYGELMVGEKATVHHGFEKTSIGV